MKKHELKSLIVATLLAPLIKETDNGNILEVFDKIGALADDIIKKYTPEPPTKEMD